MLQENISGFHHQDPAADISGISGPVEVLIKTKWCRANASVTSQHFGISILVKICTIEVVAVTCSLIRTIKIY